MVGFPKIKGLAFIFYAICPDIERVRWWLVDAPQLTFCLLLPFGIDFADAEDVLG
jgi:hypothetical protein